MTRFGLISSLAGFLAFIANPGGLTAATNATPDFKEVYDLIRAHSAGVSDAELNRAAVQGLLTALSPRVSLAADGAATNAPAATPLLSQTNLLDGGIVYLRAGSVRGGLAEAVGGNWRRLGATNKLGGLVLDLRYADGDDYAAAAAVADLFAGKAQPLLNWGNGMVSSHEKGDAFREPVAVLVNRETARAAEALAALLRQTGAGLILGGRTAGAAMVMLDYPLKDGERLRIAAAPITLGDGSALPAEGVKPDIEVAVRPEDERAYYADAFVVLAKTGLPAGAKPLPADQTNRTNAAARHGRMNEAELVREHKEGVERDADADAGTPPPQTAEAAKPVVNDPALARALDLLKGLAVVRPDRF